MQHLQKEKYETPALAALELAWPVAPVLIISTAVALSAVVVSLLVWFRGLVLGTSSQITNDRSTKLYPNCPVKNVKY